MVTTRYYSDLQEKHIAKVTGGKIQRNSGGTKFGGGDIHTNKFFIEAKTPTQDKKSFSIKKEWLAKVKEQSFSQGKEEGVLAFRFSPEDKQDYYILTEKQFLDYLEWRENEETN